MKINFIVISFCIILSYFVFIQTSFSKPVKVEVGIPLEIKEVKASGKQPPNQLKDEHFDPENAIDGNKSTRWSSNFEEPQWLEIDLGQPQEVDKILIFWERAYAKSYSVEISNDGDNWKEIFFTEEGEGEEDKIEINEEARFIRINCLKRKTNWGFSIWEIKVYGKKKWMLI